MKKVETDQTHRRFQFAFFTTTRPIVLVLLESLQHDSVLYVGLNEEG